VRRRAALAVGFALLILATIAVFALIDSASHSASDTLRPFLLLMVPVWTIAALVARLVLRRATR
jgi:hypothetical protein